MPKNSSADIVTSWHSTTREHLARETVRLCVAALENDERRLGGLLYDLTFVNVTMKDAQVIQCNISNKHGYNFTNAYINVYSQCHPLFTHTHAPRPRAKQLFYTNLTVLI